MRVTVERNIIIARSCVYRDIVADPVENIIIAFMQAMWLENTLSFVKNIKARNTLLIAIAVICSIWWAIASNYYINNTDVETNTATESVQEELYWNESN